MKPDNKTHSQGFTLIELLFVVAIIAITLAIGLPNFKSIIDNNRLTASANDMVAALQLARSESIKHIQVAGVAIPSGGGSTWKVFLGNSANVLQKYTASETVRVDVISIAPGDETPKYRSDGRLTTNTAIIFRFTTTRSTTEQRTLTISPSGRVSVTNP